MVKRIAFLTDAAPSIGLGHLRRCLTIAEGLSEQGWDVEFIALPSERTIADLMTSHGYRYYPARPLDVARGDHDEYLAGRFHVLFVDSYALGDIHLVNLHRLAPLIVSIDDFNRPCPGVDLLINPIPGAGVPSPGQVCLFGPQYAILRSEFRSLPPRIIDGPVRRILVTLGGSDPLRVTDKVLTALDFILPAAIEIHVVRGPLFTRRGSEPIPLRFPHRIIWHENPPNMAKMMQDSDLCITAAGQTLYELAATGLPSVAIQVADNQTTNIQAFVTNGTVVSAGWGSSEECRYLIQDSVATLLRSEGARKTMAACGQKLVDGFGALRIATAISLHSTRSPV